LSGDDVCLGHGPSTMPPPFLSLVFPAYNEGSRIVETLTCAVAYLREHDLDGEVVVVDDGSEDDTAEKARAFAAGHPEVRVLSYTPNRGKGGAVRQGMLAARGQYRVFLDVDLATPLEELANLIPLLEAGADFVIGSRHCRGATLAVKQRPSRRFMGWVFRKLAGALLPLEVTDITCGFKGFTAQTAEELFGAQRERGWAFDAELIFLARKWNLDLRELPVRWYDSGDTRVQPLRNAVESIRELLRIRRRAREGAYAHPQPGTDS